MNSMVYCNYVVCVYLDVRITMKHESQNFLACVCVIAIFKIRSPQGRNLTIHKNVTILKGGTKIDLILQGHMHRTYNCYHCVQYSHISEVPGAQKLFFQCLSKTYEFMSLSHTFPSGQGTHAAHVLYQLAQQPPRRLSFIVALCQDENTSDRVQCNIQSFTCHFNQYRLQYSLNTHQVMLTFLEMARANV